MGRSAKLVLGLVAALLAAAALIGSAAAKKPIAHVSNCGDSVYRPHQLVVYCGDAGVVLTGIDWSRWGRRSANGDATAVTKTCDPDCATGASPTRRCRCSSRTVISASPPLNRISCASRSATRPATSCGPRLAVPPELPSAVGAPTTG